MNATIALATQRLSAFRWRQHSRWQRWKRALNYATGHLSEADADQIRYECQQIAGFYPLEVFTVDGVLNTFRDCYGDHPELERLARDAAARVANKWSGNGDCAGTAEDWAIDLIFEYAKADGIELPRERED
jgi:hypothetical protein